MEQSKPDFAVAMGQRIKVQRELVGLTQGELAYKIGYKEKSAISKIEAGKTEIPTSKLYRLADILETSVAYLMGWTEGAMQDSKSCSSVSILETSGHNLSEDEDELLSYYRKMNDQGKLSALLSVKGLSEQELFKKEDNFAADG